MNARMDEATILTHAGRQYVVTKLVFATMCGPEIWFGISFSDTHMPRETTTDEVIDVFTAILKLRRVKVRNPYNIWIAQNTAEVDRVRSPLVERLNMLLVE